MLFSGICAVGALASELLRILNSPLLVGQLARDSVKAGMRMEPNEVSCLGGVVLRALEFLAGYGLFITAGMDRTVGRILDSVYSLQGTVPANMVGLLMHASSMLLPSSAESGSWPMPFVSGWMSCAVTRSRVTPGTHRRSGRASLRALGCPLILVQPLPAWLQTER